MLKKSLLTISFIGILLWQCLSLAAPAVCPSAAKIQTGSLFTAKLINGNSNFYAAIQIDNYDTADQWVFSISPITAQNEDEALSKAKNALPTVTGMPTPAYLHGEQESWVCWYQIASGYVAAAVTPAPIYLHKP